MKILGLTLAVSCLAWPTLVLAGSEPVRRVDAFDKGLSGWELLNATHWSVVEGEGTTVLRLNRTGPQLPPVRRPGEYALASGEAVRDVCVTVRARSLEPSSKKGRDIVLIFGYCDPTHFYYAHISNDSNRTTHNVIMKVAGDRRETIHREEQPEPRLEDGWRDLRVVHHAEGRIAVFVDDMETPLMTAQDTDYPEGRVGMGSFDDRAEFDRVVIEYPVP
jgi:hypothetical protein